MCLCLPLCRGGLDHFGKLLSPKLQYLSGIGGNHRQRGEPFCDPVFAVDVVFLYEVKLMHGIFIIVLFLYLVMYLNHF